MIQHETFESSIASRGALNLAHHRTHARPELSRRPRFSRTGALHCRPLASASNEWFIARKMAHALWCGQWEPEIHA